ncbi:MAG: hypothetical protein MUC56_09200 [Thermoanaerobaculales bacterium]|nr:hypothetical protein [Thermoanaerobaculales bacterium]
MSDLYDDGGSGERPGWFADFERKLVDLIRTAPGAQQQDLGACLTVLIPRGGSADNAIFGGVVTSRDEVQSQMQEELLTAVVWALLADGVEPDLLRATFEHAMIVADPADAQASAMLMNADECEIVN